MTWLFASSVARITFAFLCFPAEWVGVHSTPTLYRQIVFYFTIAVFALVIATLILASLLNIGAITYVADLNSNAGAALLAYASIFSFVLRFVSINVSENLTDHFEGSNILVQIERETVHASDDAPNKQISVSYKTPLREIVALAMADKYLPSISGGNATWIIDSYGVGIEARVALGPIAVWAQQWSKVKFLIDGNSRAALHFGKMKPLLKFRYLCQKDPILVLASFEGALH